MKIGVLGLGYVGIVNIACLSKNGHTVYCSDVKPHKVNLVKEGKSPIMEPEVSELIANGIQNRNIIPVHTTAELLPNVDVIITCVGTPSKADGEVNLDYLNNVLAEIVAGLKPNDKKYLVFRSTVPPGTTEKIIAKHLGTKFPMVVPVFYPEFLREGSAVKDFYNYDRIVLGHTKGSNLDLLVDLFNVCSTAEVFLTDYRTAEYAKYLDNGFHALKVAFANEIFGLGSEFGVDINTAHRIFIADNKLNISARYLKPGLPFGGSCLPKDVRELQHLMLQSKRKYPLLQNVIPSNERFIEFIIEKIRAFGKKKIAFMGVTFKNYSDDLRESPILKIINVLHAEGFELKLYDEDLNIDAISLDVPSLLTHITDLNNVMKDAELVVVSKRYLTVAAGLIQDTQVLFNLADLQNPEGLLNSINLYEK